ncbi:hypothetical protein ACFW0I_37670 [[Kitasatospora] papulosa]|uniref:hypothetical protein n=2 Tax=[Kitasatospora] papulosa TaxID=1464011 RepID=UPI00369D1C63
MQNFESMQYTGENRDEIVAWVQNAQLLRQAEDGTLTLALTAYGDTYESVLPVGYWVLQWDRLHQGAVHPDAYKRQYFELPGT